MPACGPYTLVEQFNAAGRAGKQVVSITMRALERNRALVLLSLVCAQEVAETLVWLTCKARVLRGRRSRALVL